MEKVIIKVQRSIMPPDQVECLVYDEGKRKISLQPVSDEVMNAMKKRPGMFAFKAFFEAEWDPEFKGWLIGKMVDDQPW